MIIHLRSKNQAHLRLTLLLFLLPEKNRVCFYQFLAQCHSLIIFSKVHNFSFSNIIRKPVIEQTISPNRKSIIKVLLFSLLPKQVLVSKSSTKPCWLQSWKKQKQNLRYMLKDSSMTSL